MVTQDDSRPAGFGLYLHWPFCKSKCPYCDFNSHVRAQIDEAAWHNAMRRELAYWGERAKTQPLTSIFFGGGTPSLMPPSLAAALIADAKTLWPHDLDSLEITLEANPTSVEADKLKAFRDAGVNRVSLGVQALNDVDLKALGRQHGAYEARQAIELAQSLFKRVSFDLIYAREGQTADAWQTELKAALAIGTSHLSLYQLTIEAGTQFATLYQRGDLILPDEERAAELYDLTDALTKDAGVCAYEISNYAREGQACRHNLTYWRYGDYVGVGAGAHGRVTMNGQKFATRTHRAPEEWLRRVELDGHATMDLTALPLAEQFDEYLLMGLRLTEGLSISRTEALFEKPLASLVNANKLALLQKHGLVKIEGDTLAATKDGRLRLNPLIAELAS